MSFAQPSPPGLTSDRSPSVVDHDEVDVADEDDVDEEAEARAEAETHHRFTKVRPRESKNQPRRIIRLRDKRGRRGSDPPVD